MASRDRVPSSIYHYTDANGLLGILANRELWVTDVEFLNDPQEVRHAVEALEDSLVQQIEVAKAEGDDGTHDSLRPLLDAVRRRFPRGRAFQNVRERTTYVTSFCDHGDLLSMWRGYAGGAGFSIEFDPLILSDATAGVLQLAGDTTDDELEAIRAANFGLETSIVAVSYEDEQIATICDLITTEMYEGGPEGAGERADNILDRFGGAFASVKHSTFKEEGEVRLVAFPLGDLSPAVKIRSSAGRLVPYLAVSFPHAAIRSITMGPSGGRARQGLALERHFGSSARGEWGHVAIRLSETPYQA